jgi:signal transduction histidine kinase
VTRTGGEEPDGSRLDRFLAIAAGPAQWRDDRDPSSADSAAGLLELAALGGIVTVSATAAVRDDHGWPHPALPYVLVGVLVALIVVLVRPTVLWLFDRPMRRHEGVLADVRLIAAVRTTGFLVVIALWSVVVGGVRVPHAWMFGMVAGCEATLAARSVGATLVPWRWWRSFLRSWFHLFVAVVVMVTAITIGGREGVVVGATVFAAVHLAVFASVLECWVLEVHRRRLDADLARSARAVEVRQHRARAHWLHDDLCSELRLVRLKLETSELAPAEVLAQLDELDHRLRVGQLDALLQSGSVRLAEVIQPFVRRAQAHGLRVREVPRFEQASLELDGETGRMVQRAAAVLVTNSIQAGAREISIVASIESSTLVLVFEDDAGGFDPATIPPGRGLDSLRHELGPGGLELRRTDRGIAAEVTVTRHRRPTDQIIGSP